MLKTLPREGSGASQTLMARRSQSGCRSEQLAHQPQCMQTTDWLTGSGTAGGVRLEALDENLMLRNRPGVFVAGEMFDWEAPTGGYLLTACFASGLIAGRGGGVVGSALGSTR